MHTAQQPRCKQPSIRHVNTHVHGGALDLSCEAQKCATPVHGNHAHAPSRRRLVAAFTPPAHERPHITLWQAEAKKSARESVCIDGNLKYTFQYQLVTPARLRIPKSHRHILMAVSGHNTPTPADAVTSHTPCPTGSPVQCLRHKTPA